MSAALSDKQRIERLEKALAGLTLASRGVLGKRFWLANPELRQILEDITGDVMDLNMLVG